MRKLFVAIFIFFLVAVRGQQPIGELFQEMSILPWNSDQILQLTYSPNLTFLEQFYIDLDQEDEEDLLVTIASDANAMFHFSSISFSCFNGYSAHIDTNFVEHFQYVEYLDEGYVVMDSTRVSSIVKKYAASDSLLTDSTYLTQIAHFYKNYVNHQPLEHTIENLVSFLNDTSFVVIENATGDLFILKVWQEHSTKLHVFEIRTNAQLPYSDEIFCYPNPSTDVIKFIGNFEKIQAHSSNGQMVLDVSNTQTNPEFNVSHLTQGVYVFSCFKDNQWKRVRVMKI